MANNYCKLSSMLHLPEDKLEAARVIVARVMNEIENGDEDEDILVSILPDGVWFHTHESANPEQVETIAKALVEELGIEEPFYCSWAYTCSKPRIDEFGGGAFVVKRGMETHWVDAMSAVHEFIHDEETCH